MNKKEVVLFLCGINLIFIQFIMIREFSVLLFCTELVILTTAVSYFIGYSLGYLLSDKIPNNIINNLAIITFFIHLFIFFLMRFLVGYLSLLNVSRLSTFILFIIGSFIISSFYTIFLPKFISESTSFSLPKYYSTEISGSIVGLIFILTIGQLSFLTIFLVYFIVLLLIIYLLIAKKRMLIVLMGTLFFYSLIFPLIDKASTEFFYRNFYNLRNCKLVYSTYSPYQKIEVIKDEKGFKRLYLNGLQYFNPSHLEIFNFYLSELPARLKKKSSILIIGSGSMSSVFKVLPFSTKITTVEIDKEVYSAGIKYFSEYNHWQKIKNWEIVIDDAKHFLMNTKQNFDLIILDIPAPYYIQTALLFTKEFYSIVHSKLRKGGIISIYLCNKFSTKKIVSLQTKVIAAAKDVFNDFVIINSRLAHNGFLIAGDKLNFRKRDIKKLIKKHMKNDKFRIFTKSKVTRIIKDAKPSSLSNLDIILDLNLWALLQRK
jgi:spermidine synthase